MENDKHLGTGKYDPETYWNERALRSAGNVHKAVCIYHATTLKNKAMERVQFKVLDDLLKDVNLDNKLVLEIGCGFGRLSEYFINKNADYTGVDISEEMIKYAQKHCSGKYIKLDTMGLPFKDSFFDLVISVTVLHHNPYDIQEKMIDEIQRVTKVDGYILVMEDVKNDDIEYSFNMFPRQVKGWKGCFTRGNDYKIEKVRLAHWWITFAVVSNLYKNLKKRFNFLHPKKEKVQNNNRSDKPNNTSILLRSLSKLILVVGMIIDPLLLEILPPRFATNIGLLIHKSAKG